METPTQTALVLAAQAGDQKAFETLVGAYQRELLVHCYRMLGSLSDAEDLVQETLLRAWEKRTTLTSPESYRAWLYRIATNLCLNRLTRAPRRFLPSATHPPSDPSSPAPPRLREPIWLEPFPDDLLADPGADPEDRAERSERITLAFLMALQHLTPVQRAILLLREVLEWEASEVAEWLNLSVPAVNSALQRARRALHQRNVGSEEEMALPRPQLQDLLDRYVTLWEQADIPGLVALLREDAWFTMPPLPAWVQGRAAIATLFQTSLFTPARQWHLLPTRANGSPAFGLYRREAGAEDYQLFGLVVLGVEGEQIGSLVAFLDVASFTSFGLPSTLPSSLRQSKGSDDFAVLSQEPHIRGELNR
jgi:RNA polymerase sigma-70 factor, ECF subfamily